ncbi:MAG TPA: hydrogenase maturation protease [Thermoflexia bacterium]|jgi:hydrogenase maturation protease|nr:hydrogenase maturation protease [Thermoflexia bacterium]
MRVAVIGLGNPLRGDDGIGPRVVAELHRRELPEGVEAIDGGTGGLDLLRLMEGWDRVIVVDAAEIGREPGAFARFTPEEVRLRLHEGDLSLHNAGLPEALALASALNHPLPPITLFGVQPKRIGWEAGLSPVVERTIPALVEAILDEVSEAAKSAKG